MNKILKTIEYGIEYYVEGYKVDHMFSMPNNWGRQVRMVPFSKLPTHTDEDVINAAKHFCPPGYVVGLVQAQLSDRSVREVFKSDLVKSLEFAATIHNAKFSQH